MVTESFEISGRGAGIFFEGADESLQFGQTLDVEVLVPGAPPIAAFAAVEAARVQALPGERITLLIQGVSAEQVPVGSTIRVKGTA